MATRQLVTSHPDIACDICGRRLLRGEHPELFLAGAERRTVCELCAPRATHEGWLRAIEGAMPGHGATRARRGRTLLDRLRGLRQDPSRERQSRSGEERLSLELEPYQFLDGPPPRMASSAPASFLGESFTDDEQHEAYRAESEHHDAAPADADHPAVLDRSVEALALEAFNASEGPRRIAGIARALGAPEVSVRSHGPERAQVVIAWELCWYRYEVNLDHAPARVELAERGIELEQLPAEDRLSNAAADERGELHGA